MRTHHVIAVVAVTLISFGAKIFFFSPPTAEADVHPNIKSLPAAVAHTNANSIRAPLFSKKGQPAFNVFLPVSSTSTKCSTRMCLGNSVGV